MSYDRAMEQVQFTQMRDGTYEEYQFLHGLERQFIDALPDRILDGLRLLDDGLGGYRVTRLEHSLQSATRAERDGAEECAAIASGVAGRFAHEWPRGGGG